MGSVCLWPPGLRFGLWLTSQVKLYEQDIFGTCPRMLCTGQPLLPVGLSDELGVGKVRALDLHTPVFVLYAYSTLSEPLAAVCPLTLSLVHRCFCVMRRCADNAMLQVHMFCPCCSEVYRPLDPAVADVRAGCGVGGLCAVIFSSLWSCAVIALLLTLLYRSKNSSHRLSARFGCFELHLCSVRYTTVSGSQYR